MTSRSAQDAWLDHLNDAAEFNDWVVSCFADRLRGKVLEIGCGTGNFTRRLARFASEITAADINPDYVRVASERLRGCANVHVCTADARTAQWPAAFDGIVALDVLEHIEDDVGFLRNLANALSPDGVLILKVPAGPWLYSSMDRAIGHYRRYSRDSLGESLAGAGYAVERAAYFNVAGMLGWWLNGKMLHREVPPRDQVVWFERLVPIFRRVEQAITFPFGLSLLTVARLPARPKPFDVDA